MICIFDGLDVVAASVVGVVVVGIVVGIVVWRVVDDATLQMVKKMKTVHQFHFERGDRL
jgi:uncharacterized membrane-anchored protein YhcB (DUF1043 family)